jgi:hypothetical protein
MIVPAGSARLGAGERAGEGEESFGIGGCISEGVGLALVGVLVALEALAALPARSRVLAPAEASAVVSAAALAVAWAGVSAAGLAGRPARAFQYPRVSA